MQLQVIKRIDHSLRKIKVKLTRKKKKKTSASSTHVQNFLKDMQKLNIKGSFSFLFLIKKNEKKRKVEREYMVGVLGMFFISGIRKVEGFFFHKG